jgi:molecular chaperone GrpE
MSDERKGPPKLDLERLLSEEGGAEAEGVEIDGWRAVDEEASPPPAEAPVPPAPQAGEYAELEGRHLRLRADFDNFRRRAEREAAELRERAAEGLVRELLPIVDNLARALVAATDTASSFREGVALIQRQLAEVLEREGLEPLAVMGEPFDPNLHEAVGRQESADLPPDRVVVEVRKGYRFRGRLLRPAQVMVTVAPAASAGKAAPESAPWDG